MAEKTNLSIVIAEQSPVIASGLNYCLHHLPEIKVHTIETDTCADLYRTLKEEEVDIVLVNPTFGGSVNPGLLKESIPGDYRVAAIETGPIDKNIIRNYDGSVSIADDLATIASKIQALGGKEYGEPMHREALSQREKEILSHVVRGMTNKEIADKLFLSVHTVITHRRNISRKLEIHSVTGLTIYAIVNHLVDLSEIQL